jgi:diguanylate cyclase (GGDEF)-like protein
MVDMPGQNGESTPAKLRSTDLLMACLGLLRRATGAATVSLYISGLSGTETDDMLVHDGPEPRVPELADRKAARTFLSRRPAMRLEQSEPLLEQMASELGQGQLIRLSSPQSILGAVSRLVPDRGDSEQCRRAEDRFVENISAPAIWLGVRTPDGVPLSLPQPTVTPASIQEKWDWLVALGGALAWHTQQISTLLDDPVTGLPGRVHFEASIRRCLEQAQREETPFSMIMLNPDDFDAVNDRLGRDSGDQAIREVAGRIVRALRNTDLVHRYGGAIFTVSLPRTARANAEMVAEKIHRLLSEDAYLEGAVRLSFSSGLVHLDLDDDEAKLVRAGEMIRRADQALNHAKHSGGRQMVTWEPSLEEDGAENMDRLRGIFTASATRDYRNMLLLWDTMAIISAKNDSQEMIRRILARLQSVFRFDLIQYQPWDVEEGYGPAEGVGSGWSGTTTVSDELLPVLEQARTEENAVESRVGQGAGGRARHGWAVPLITRGKCLGCLWFLGVTETNTFEPGDITFLKALAGQLAMALDQASLVAREHQRQQSEQRRLRGELNNLRRALDQARLVHRSPEMENLLAMVQQVAPTDATVLITGESGTGKELLSRTIHEMSLRRKKPYVIVDCGAIASTLIESELFGRERGAYTGADQQTVGRLAEADGGTVVLDEIAELPIEVQSRLLRFVQEKQVTRVGGSHTRQVDVRLIAITNRDLAAEVRAGTFREDLFFRLNVVNLEAPPLRARPDDIQLLARHFLERAAIRFQKPVHRFTSAAWARLQSYPWPGNVRELENRVMKAVILCRDEVLDRSHLGFEGEAEWDREAVTTVIQTAEPPTEDAWSRLTRLMGRMIEVALAQSNGRPLPLGTWLAEDTVLCAREATDGNLSQGATLLGMPETTFRRRVDKAQANVEMGLAPRMPGWQDVQLVIGRLLQADNAEGEDLLREIRERLLELVAQRLPGKMKEGAGLMGVSEPTYRNWRSSRG